MYVGVVLLCQASSAHPTLFPVLMPSPCLVLKILQNLKALVLMTKLLMQRLGKELRMMAESTVPARAKIPNQGILRVLDRLRGSVVVPRKLLMTGE